MFENAVDLQGQSQQSVASGDQLLLDVGVYDVWADEDIYVKVSQTNNANTVSNTNGYLIRAGNTVPVRIQSPSYIAATAAFHLHKVKSA